jgi:hypothetical protein
MTDKIRDPLSKVGRFGAPFCYLLDVAHVSDEGLDIAISANPQERQALADFNKIPKIGHLDAAFHVVTRGEGCFNVSGEVHARITQICVASLDPFESDVVETIDVDFAPQDQIETISVDLDTEEPPDPIIDGKIDLGALAGEFLALGLDPYPRKPGARFELANGIGGPRDVDSPFEILKQLNTLK